MMIALGSFSFPAGSTVCHLSMIEAKSKVRKEIRIQSMMQGHTRTILEEQMDIMRGMLEAFDRQEQHLSLQPGRYYMGRRREFHLSPCPDSPLAWVDLSILTEDRFERSLALHEHSFTWQGGTADISLLNQGNWRSPLFIQFNLQTPASRMQIVSPEGLFDVQEAMTAGSTVKIDSESRLVSLNDQNIVIPVEEPFPGLFPGINQLHFTVSPANVLGSIIVRYRDIWV